MKILVFPHRLEIGGSQTNALDLAIGLRDRGHELVFFGTPGAFAEAIDRAGFRLLEAPSVTATPSPAMVRALDRAVRAERPDLVHAWDWPQYFNATVLRVLRGVPVVGSNMSMSVSRSAPRSIPLTYGTPQLADEARSITKAPVLLLEPPVNTDRDAPGTVDGAAFRREWRIGDDEVLATVVSRLVGWLKLEGIRRGMEAVTKLAADHPVRFVVVGDGTARAELDALAAQVNGVHGREVVTMTGALIDPRPAYEAADVVIGMGGSVLRGMAFATSAIVLGEREFSEVFEPESAPRFLREGFYGLGPSGTSLHEQLARLVSDAALRERLSGWSHQLVVERFSHHAAAASLEAFLEEGLAAQPSRLTAASDVARATAARAAARLLRR